MLHIQRRDTGTNTTLHLTGTIDLSVVLRLRDVAFSIIGERPETLCLDLRAVNHIEIAGLHTLVTISRVARLVNIRCFLLPPPGLRETLLETGLTRMLPIGDEVSPPRLTASEERGPAFDEERCA